MLLFLYGLDNYRLRQAVNLIESQYKEKLGNNTAVFKFDLSQEEDSQFKELSDKIKAVSLFEPEKLIICENVFISSHSKNVYEMIKDRHLSKDNKITLVFIENLTSGALKQKNNLLWKVLSSKPSQAQSIEPISGSELNNWVIKEAKSAGASISSKNANKLISVTGNDSWRLYNEIQKLASFKNGSQITEDDIELLISDSSEDSIFKMLDALSANNKAHALFLLEQQLSHRQDPQYIVSMIAYQLRTLISIKDLMEKAHPYSSIAKKLKLNSWVMEKSYGYCRNFSYEKLKSGFTHLADLDINMKSGKIGKEDGLYQFLLDF
ncbi:MAG: DNA polymerase III subunit delta [Candidatus Yanofskybacteria bacterium CG10_big_fil_rev_8_21_14_0_10_36_16]|uniref:DNA polymerase III subunit delta n=1 Tax=Candidatus Yanofskybacteria bacterium CG10_big_fil_rev_8_21_14_0_10_36_16 TaxID=1975096 RepID=A0A2J0Q7V5_9BACT|nr:MAG: DNA polymerase III subunit delta [Candidatus Yanofskybacteria bacterium CG10_big_fil_rev_8_21_14_0_10_36_16]